MGAEMSVMTQWNWGMTQTTTNRKLTLEMVMVSSIFLRWSAGW
jgi:hypothetical protein